MTVKKKIATCRYDSLYLVCAILTCHQEFCTTLHNSLWTVSICSR